MSGPHTLAGLGWSAFFADQCRPDEAELAPRRVATVHRSRMGALSEAGPVKLVLPVHTNTGDYAVGDWVLVDPATQSLHRRLDRRTVLERRREGSPTPQLAAANVDALFIVTSCNADFNAPRLERYLALANQGGAEPVIVLTKADVAEDAERYRGQALSLQRGLRVVIVNPREPEAAAHLAAWCGPGRTVAVVGSSGVGKSTLVNTLAGPDHDAPQATGGIREHDAKGRHTTTARSLHAIAGGGWVIDTPGIRSLQLGDAAEGLDTLFAEITELAPACRFRDCTHAHEPGCAVRAAVAEGRLDPERVSRWRTLRAENRGNTVVATGPRGNKRR
ncbi:ribosome small subunit-dependent GTPase A [Methylobacterium sp. J-068]|uniref:ribosome small subunit-dependent GTPase A n=1 Tax=Methylobacterium sp. J-068 TaxID=2836649 RepID=UPI001FB88033|nr:ribosome small subunit-dependent GTPase A [Methylobacterium sp. J-068]MCJ2036033.1 ribosome small subunit-dependent GTPase A [Methylobacterium sp. J-068]